MIKPVNGNLVIEPQKYNSFVAQDKGTYQEIGVVKSKRPWYKFWWPKMNDKVYFDSWLAGKFPTGKGEEYFWLVSWNDVKAIDGKE